MRNKVTIFSIPKPFRDHIGIIQTNAIRSWLRLPNCDVILLGDDEGVKDFAQEYGILHIPDIARNEYNTPLLNSVFSKAEEAAKTDLMAYVNADIILLQDFVVALSMVIRYDYLLAGQRFDYNLEGIVSFDDPDCEEALRFWAKECGKLHSISGVDYYVYRKGLFDDMSPFAIGRTTYDNWFIYKALSKGVPVIDATEVVTCIHQNHERTYASVDCISPSGDESLVKGLECERNLQMAGGRSYLRTLASADFRLTSDGLKPQGIVRRLGKRLVSTIRE